MPFDASIFQNANRPTVALNDPLEVQGRVYDTQNKLNRIRQYQAEQAAGQAFQGAIDPQTGLMNQNKLGVALSQMDPRNSIAIQPALQAGGTMQSTNLSNQGAQQGIDLKRNQFIGQKLGALLDLPDEQLHAGAVDAMQEAEGNGLLTHKQSLTGMGRLPDDPARLRTYLRQQQLSLQGASEQQGQIYGAPGTQDTGGQLESGVTASPARGGGFTPGSTTDRTVSPESAATPRTVIGADGRTTTAPSSVTMDPRAVPPQLRTGTGRYPALSNAPAVPGAGGAAFSGPTPGQTENNEADVKQYRSDLNGVGDRQTAVQSLQKAQHALEATLTTGRGSDAVNKMLGFISTIAPETAKQIGVADANQQYDLAHKYLLDYARKSGAAAGSDAQLQASLGSNAGTEINKGAALEVVKTNIGRERQRIAQVQSHSDPNGIGYGASASKFSTDTDPRAFAWDAYTPAERTAIENKLSPVELKKLDRSLFLAAKLKLIQVPGAE